MRIEVVRNPRAKSSRTEGVDGSLAPEHGNLVGPLEDRAGEEGPKEKTGLRAKQVSGGFRI